MILIRLLKHFGDREIPSFNYEDILGFLSTITNSNKQSTKKLRYSLLTAFFNFIRNSNGIQYQNPCDNPILRKIFKEPKNPPWAILDKEIVDEMIFRTVNKRNRLMLELMARGGMRIGEVLNITSNDIEDRKLIIRDPKSSKETEVVFIPHKVAHRLKEYIRNKDIQSYDKIFPISYQAARMAVKKTGNLVGIDLKPHDLRRHAATFASRSGTPIEIVSKIILRHTNLSTTQRYLGKVTDIEAMKWIDSLHG
ncbi:tyrosine-type recombinase/integrase [Thermodesulfobacteriota bacterium]